MTQSEAFWLIGACCTFITREARITTIADAVEQRHEIDSLRAQDAMIKTAANAMQQHDVWTDCVLREARISAADAT
jgi:hypothetical protein